MTHTQSEDTMTSEWKTVKLGEIAQINPTETLKKGTTAKKVAMENLRPYCRDIPEYELSEYNGGAKFRNGDTIMARITPCLENGKIAKVGILDEGEVGFGSTEFIVFRANEGYDEDFVYYLVYSSDVKAPAIKSMVGSSGRQRVQTDVVQNLQLRVPPLDMQRRIAAVLKPLDDKIEMNARINARLERVAQALFKRHFVRFEPYGGTMPPGWRVGTLGELPILITDYVSNGSFASLKQNVKLYQEPNYAYFIRNTDLKSGSFGVYVDEHSYKFLSRSVLHGNEIIISNVGDVGSVFLCPKLNKPMTLGNNIIMLRPKMEEMRYWLYIWFKWGKGQSLIKSITGGSAQPKFNKTDFRRLSFPYPSEELLQSFHNAVAPMFDMIAHNTDESRTLARLRDVLLPRLMSGAVDVRQVYLNSIQKGGSR